MLPINRFQGAGMSLECGDAKDLSRDVSRERCFPGSKTELACGAGLRSERTPVVAEAVSLAGKPV